ncbi:tolloid-like protein 2 isoform X3 [Hermetia illucens]|uniref:tolloid-like protein 2 isoform X3 n=1 Tax=Hermetia illucens TaxID=343691 RepID=UPI0018CC5E8F|nr:tolloid-like protein 2 isoform X3 [Hermetia illucens]
MASELLCETKESQKFEFSKHQVCFDYHRPAPTGQRQPEPSRGSTIQQSRSSQHPQFSETSNEADSKKCHEFPGDSCFDSINNEEFTSERAASAHATNILATFKDEYAMEGKTRKLVRSSPASNYGDFNEIVFYCSEFRGDMDSTIITCNTGNHKQCCKRLLCINGKVGGESISAAVERESQMYTGQCLCQCCFTEYFQSCQTNCCSLSKDKDAHNYNLSTTTNTKNPNNKKTYSKDNSSYKTLSQCPNKCFVEFYYGNFKTRYCCCQCKCSVTATTWPRSKSLSTSSSQSSNLSFVCSAKAVKPPLHQCTSASAKSKAKRKAKAMLPTDPRTAKTKSVSPKPEQVHNSRDPQEIQQYCSKSNRSPTVTTTTVTNERPSSASPSAATSLSAKLHAYQPIRQYHQGDPVLSKLQEIRTSTVYALGDLQKLLRALLPFFLLFNMLPLLYAECDQTFISRAGGPQNGTFTAPLLHNPANHTRQCLYIFLAGPGQRVEVVFTTFNLRGTPPDGSAVGEIPACAHEYMDIYAEVQTSDAADLINSPFGGRYCGPIPPRRRISMYRAIALSFFTNKNETLPDLFTGRYSFINASEYEIGIPISGSPCSYTVTPSSNKTGALISPTYPGAYPKDLSCTYTFLGETNQRVRLEFRDFDLFFGGPHCPFDFVKVYDGPDNSSALIGTYCGQQRNLVIYSSESSLYVHFFTLPRTANTQNRGFKGIYEFSESFVKLDFIQQNDGIHMRGSECDQKVLSKKQSVGYVYSPNYPYLYIPKTVCRYFIYGMQDAQHLERVRLEFFLFDIPKVEHKDKSESNCTDGYLKVYLKGQETMDAYDKFDHELCGNETHSVVSDGPRLAMVFSSGEIQGRGFKAKYTFETEYKIPGTAAPDGSCSFTYRSSSKKKGDFNSPRYPSNYPSDTNCSYMFMAMSNEQVTIVFDHFRVKADNVNTTGGAYGASVCFEDWLEIYVLYRDGSDRFLGRYCGMTAPGPVESPKGAVGIRVLLHTDLENVASGFKARYVFETAKSEFGDCGGNYSGQDSGIITSPNYPANYKGPAKNMASSACNWYITARSGYKISINFEFFSVEGDPPGRGCAAAVLRLWTNLESEASPIELCGEKNADDWHYISQGQSVRISFITTDKTIGAQGFRIVWTEIQDSGPGPPSSMSAQCESTYHFECASGYCIADKLRCDGVKNCGPKDDSDETNCES